MGLCGAVLDGDGGISSDGWLAFLCGGGSVVRLCRRCGLLLLVCLHVTCVTYVFRGHWCFFGRCISVNCVFIGSGHITTASFFSCAHTSTRLHCLFCLGVTLNGSLFCLGVTLNGSLRRLGSSVVGLGVTLNGSLRRIGSSVVSLGVTFNGSLRRLGSSVVGLCVTLNGSLRRLGSSVVGLGAVFCRRGAPFNPFANAFVSEHIATLSSFRGGGALSNSSGDCGFKRNLGIGSSRRGRFLRFGNRSSHRSIQRGLCVGSGSFRGRQRLGFYTFDCRRLLLFSLRLRCLNSLFKRSCRLHRRLLLRLHHGLIQCGL